MPSNRHCIYHANCTDGLMAAGVVYHKFQGDCFFHAYNYGWAPPDIANSEIFIVDFSFPAPTLYGLLGKGNKVTVIDHHKTALEELQKVRHPDFTFHFDLERSGAGLTWDVLFPDTPRPTVVDRVEDRDLWRFKYADSRAVHMALQLVSKTRIDAWASFITDTEADYSVLLGNGQPILRYHELMVEQFVERPHWMQLGGHWIPVVNAPYMYASDVAGALAARGLGKFAATYYLDGKVAHLSLRSRGEFDVSEVAKQYAGGGHKNAAGCIIEPWSMVQLRKKAPEAHDPAQEAMAV